MPERLAKGDQPKAAVSPTPLIRVSTRIGIGGGIGRGETAGSGRPGKPWEENPGTDWSNGARRQGYHDRGYKRASVPDLPITCAEMGCVEDSDGRCRAYLQFYGIDLSRARFMTSGDHYLRLRPPGSDSAVFARLPSGILVLSTYKDVIDCQFQIVKHPSLTIYLGDFQFKPLLKYNPARMGISVGGNNLVTVGYWKPS